MLIQLIQKGCDIMKKLLPAKKAKEILKVLSLPVAGKGKMSFTVVKK